MEVVEDPSLGASHLPFTDTKDEIKLLTSGGEEGRHAANGVSGTEGPPISVDDLLQTQKDSLSKLSEQTFMEITSNNESQESGNELSGTLAVHETSDNKQSGTASPTLEGAETKVESIEPVAESIVSQPAPVAINGVETENENVISSNMLLGVTLETEVVVESGDGASVPEIEIPNIHEETDSTNDILSHLKRQSADTNDGIENNNSNVKQEMFNQEELLDILQGNDTNTSENTGNLPAVLHREAQLALKQLSTLKRSGKPRGRRANAKPKVIKIPQNSNESKNNIVTSLVMDWEDEEDGNANETKKTDKEIPDEIGNMNVSNEVVISQDNCVAEVSTDSVNEIQDNASIVTESAIELPTPEQTQRRRVIKKKVIFDPDNPDTFTKGKTAKIKEHPAPITKEGTPETKPKSETAPRKSKSPIAKTQWKKPTPKNIKCNKRLTEVDRLLMDEGAVNMIADVTPEATKGKKTMRNKAEMIKKINQSTTTDSKEMKFRERKKEVKTDEDTKKVGSKQRPSLSSSIKSTAAGEDFETHRADDSIIYRRHSSSSYSSACMSPRQPSEGDNLPGLVPAAEPIDNLNSTVESTDLEDESMIALDLGEQIKKEDCLSLKEKLNSRLSNAFNKRKLEEPKTPKLTKQRKRNVKAKVEQPSAAPSEATFKTLSVTLESSLAIIKLGNTGLPNNAYNITALQEFEQALNLVDSRLNIAVTLLISESSSICPVLDLKPLLADDPKAVASYALELSGWIRSLLLAVEQHSKLLIVGVSGAVHGLGFSILLLADLVLASEQCVLHVSSNENLPCPGASVLTLNQRNLPQNLINDLVLFGRKMSATEAMRYGIISRIPFPNRLLQEVHNVSRDMAAQPKNSILLKKRLLRVSSAGDRETSALCNCLLAEQDLFVEFWTAAANKTLLRSYVETMQESFLGSL